MHGQLTWQHFWCSMISPQQRAGWTCTHRERELCINTSKCISPQQPHSFLTFDCRQQDSCQHYLHRQIQRSAYGHRPRPSLVNQELHKNFRNTHSLHSHQHAILPKCVYRVAGTSTTPPAVSGQATFNIIERITHQF